MIDSQKINEIIADLSLEEKATLLTGKSFWETHPIERHGIKSMFLADGPHGLRKQSGGGDHLGIAGSEPAVCFPLACATACSFDEELVYKMGLSCGEEAKAGKVAILLSPSNNIKRSPLCGRNFEYFSEDPYLCGKICSSMIKGIEVSGIAANLKPMAVNNQEFQRMTIDAIVDERALREIYYPPYEIPMKEAKVKSVMTTYNRINGIYTSESKLIFTDLVRDEWGWDGFVLTDWGANDILHRSVKAGLDLEMPSSGDAGPKDVIEAYKRGDIEMQHIDRAVRNFLTIYFQTAPALEAPSNYSLNAAHEVAREVAEGCPVLLKNDNDLLPITADKYKNVAVIGEFTKIPRYQGKGSSKVNSHKIDNLWQYLEQDNSGINFTYAAGYHREDKEDLSLIEAAVAQAKAADIAVVMVGLTEEYESEGFDREHLNMPKNHLDLIYAVAKANPNTVVVLSNGSVVKLPFANYVPTILECFLLGQAGGEALANILLGKVSPSGRLAESFIKHESQDPAFGNFPGGENGEVHYKEGVFIGYRGHQDRGNQVHFPFGHGLSYTTFDYQNLIVAPKGDYYTVSVDVTNTGKVAGKEVVQLYVGEDIPLVHRPVRELKRFDKVFLQPGETKTVSFELDMRCFAYYNTDLMDWHVNGGSFTLEIAKSCEDVVLSEKVSVKSNHTVNKTPELKYVDRVYFDPNDKTIHRNTRLAELKHHPVGKFLLKKAIEGALKSDAEERSHDSDLESGVPVKALLQMVHDLPLRNLTAFGDDLDDKGLAFMIKVFNLTRKDRLLGKVIHPFTKNK